jgi:hypothetical protein
MTIFLELGSQRAAALERKIETELAPRIVEQRPGRARPIDGRIIARSRVIADPTVLDEEQRLDQDRRDVLETMEHTAVGGRIKERSAILVADHKSGD